MQFDIHNFLAGFIRTEINNQPSKNTVLTNKNLLGKGTEQFLNTFILFLVHTESKLSDKASEQDCIVTYINKLKTKINNSNLKVVINQTDGEINFEMDKLIYNFNIDRANEKRLKNLKKTKAELSVINVSYDNDLERVKVYQLHKINQLITQAEKDLKSNKNDNTNHNTIERLYVLSLAIVITKYLLK